MRRFNDCIFSTKIRHNYKIKFLDLNFFDDEIYHFENEPTLIKYGRDCHSALIFLFGFGFTCNNDLL
jgi:hypothetical protein